jgi:hypothetical protein
MGSKKERFLNRSVCAIAVMAKQPEPGKVKTRLCPPLTPGQASDLYEAFFIDTVSLVSEIVGADTFISYDPDSAREFFSGMLSTPMKCIPQGPGDLGARLSRVSREVFLRGYRKLVILASDTPHLPQDFIRLAFARLDDIDVVLGPCDDGGYYLIGSRRHSPDLFVGIPWSTSHVLDRTIERANDAEITWDLLPPCYDIDTWEDAERLITDLQVNANGDMNGCPRTKEVLAGLAHILEDVPGLNDS